LVHGAAAREERLLRQNLIDNTTKRPHIGRRRVALRPEKHLRRPVPPRRHSLRQNRTQLLGIQRSHKPKIAQLDSAIRVDQYVGGLEVPVNQFGRMQVLERFGELVQYEPHVHVLEDPLRDDVVEIRLHVLKKQIDVLVILRANGIVELDDIGVVQLAQDLYLAVGALRVGGVLEGVEYLLQRQHATRSLLFHLPDVTVGTGTHLLDHRETTQDVRLEKVGV
jgi:hypothetical protein